MRTRGAEAAGLQGPNASGASSHLFGPSHQPEIEREGEGKMPDGSSQNPVHMQRRRQCCFYFCIFCAPATAVSDSVPRIVSSSRLFGLVHHSHRACFDSSPQPLILSFLAFHSYPFLEHITSQFFSPLCSRIYSNHTWVFGSFSLLDTHFSGKIICETPCAASRSTLIYGTVTAV